jgi:hypothetical protein
MITYENIASTLESRVPEFKENIRQHLHDQYGEVLPHLLFEDFATYFVDLLSIEDGGASSAAILHRCAGLIEEMLETGDEMIRNVVAVSFLEHTFESYNPYSTRARSYFLPKTIDMLESLEGGRGAKIEEINSELDALRITFNEVDPAGIYFDDNEDEYDPEIKALLNLKLDLADRIQVLHSVRIIFDSCFEGIEIPGHKLEELAQKIVSSNSNTSRE